MNVYRFEFISSDYIPMDWSEAIVANSLEEAMAFISKNQSGSRLRKIELTFQDVVILNPDTRSVFQFRP